jgi:crossover junction endodeoxyribonuclease RuvC
MRVIGVDPGMATTGWAVIQRVSAAEMKAEDYGCVITPKDWPWPDRLKRIAHEIRSLVQTQKPDAAAVEELFFAKNSQTAASVGHARGVVLYVLRDMGLPVFEYNPRQVKIALTGYGAADKYQMQNMVQRLLKLKSVPKPDDAADALAIALCHLNTVRVNAPAAASVHRRPGLSA